MGKLNNLLGRMASPFKPYANCLLRIGLGISFFLHGYGKLPIRADFLGWPPWHLVAWGEILAGLGILFGGLIGIRVASLGNVITRLSGGAVGVIMIGALIIWHSDWAFFIGEVIGEEKQGVLFASEQLFLLLLGIYFAIKGND